MTFLQLLQNPIFLISIIVILVGVVIYLLVDSFKDTFNSLGDFSRLPPHIENLPHQQMMPQVPPAADQTPDTGQNFNTGTLKNNNEGVPNFGRTNGTWKCRILCQGKKTIKSIKIKLT